MEGGERIQRQFFWRKVLADTGSARLAPTLKHRAQNQLLGVNLCAKKYQQNSAPFSRKCVDPV